MSLATTPFATSCLQPLDGTLDAALFSGRIQGAITPFYENERPLQGLAGLLDWRFEAIASHSLRSGMIFGKSGECVYFPVERAGRVYHWLLVGGGSLNPRARRGLLPDGSFAELKKNLPRLGLRSLAISRQDFGGLQDDYLKRALGEVPLWITQ